MKIKVFAFMMILVMALAACGSQDNLDGDSDIPAGSDISADGGNLDGQDENLPTASDSTLVTYGVAGYIQEINISDDGKTSTVFVEGELGKNGADYHRAYVKVTEDTVVYGREELTMSDLEVGQYVNVFFEGAVMESDPVQASAKQINIVPEEALEFNEDPTEE